MGLLNKNRADCHEFLAYLEDAAIAASPGANFADLLAAAPAAVAPHAAACADCREAAENLLASRTLLSALPSNASLPGPWFASRVMAAIAARKTELARVADTWTFLPKLASRLTWASSVALLVASAWLYQKPATNSPKPVATDITGEPVDNNTSPSANDDVLVSLAEKAQAPR